MKKIAFVADFDCKDFWLTRELRKDYQVEVFGVLQDDKEVRTVKWKKIFLFWRFAVKAIESLVKTSSGSTIIYWCFIMGAMAAFFCRLFGVQRQIIALNMISHKKSGLIAWARNCIYKYAMGYKNIHISLNANELVAMYEKEFALETSRSFVLHDCYSLDYPHRMYQSGMGYVFCGGEAVRDWKTLLECARLLPSVNFVCVARRKYFSYSPPPNVEMHYDIGSDEFYSFLQHASVVALPLASMAPAGLIVLIRSMLVSKPVVITRTPSVVNYIEHERNGLLVGLGNSDELFRAISLLLSDSKYAEKLGCNAYGSIKKHSPDNYMKMLNKKLSEILVK